MLYIFYVAIVRLFGCNYPIISQIGLHVSDIRDFLIDNERIKLLDIIL